MNNSWTRHTLIVIALRIPTGDPNNGASCSPATFRGRFVKDGRGPEADPHRRSQAQLAAPQQHSQQHSAAVVTRGERRAVDPKLTLTDGHKPRFLLPSSIPLPL